MNTKPETTTVEVTRTAHERIRDIRRRCGFATWELMDRLIAACDDALIAEWVSERLTDKPSTETR